MENYSFNPQRVCAKRIDFALDEEGRLHDVKFTGGCPGNLVAIGKLVEGKDAAEIANILRGNDCGGRGTSCADQFSIAIDEALKAQKNPEVMDKAALIEKVKAMADSPSCYHGLKAKVEKYLEALGTKREKIAAEELIDEIKADVVLTENLVIFAHSNRAIEKFGAENAKKFAANADALRRSGAKYCNCLACTLGVEILNNKNILLS